MRLQRDRAALMPQCQNFCYRDSLQCRVAVLLLLLLLSLWSRAHACDGCRRRRVVELSNNARLTLRCSVFQI